MVTKEQYLKALEVVEEYHKQLNLQVNITTDDKLKKLGEKKVDDFITENHDKISGRLVNCLLRKYPRWWGYGCPDREKLREKRAFIYMKDINKRIFLKLENNGPSGWNELEKVINKL